MKVYIVIVVNCDYAENIGVFSTKEKAKECADKYSSYRVDIETWELDKNLLESE